MLAVFLFPTGLWTQKALGASVGGWGLAVEPRQVEQPPEVPVLGSCELGRGELAALSLDSSGLFK